MFVDINEYVNLLNRLKITANQFLLCYLLLTDQKLEDETGKLAYIKKGTGMANLYKYATQNSTWSKLEIEDLVTKGYLLDKNNTDKHYPDYLIVTEKFINQVFKRSNAFQEFWEAYPSFVPNFNHPNGPKVKLKITDPDELEKLYNSKVRSLAEHDMVLEVVHWARDNNQLNISIENFVKSRHWLDLHKEMQRYGNVTNMRFGN